MLLIFLDQLIDVAECASLFVIIQTMAYDKGRRDGESDIVGLQITLQGIRLEE